MAIEPQGEGQRAYREAVRRHVCSVCLDCRDDGNCGLAGRVCSIEAHLPGVVQAILATRSRRMDDYVDAIRARVCAVCEHQDPAGRCALRNAGDCALETYSFLVVDAVEAVGSSSPSPHAEA